MKLSVEGKFRLAVQSALVAGLSLSGMTAARAQDELPPAAEAEGASNLGTIQVTGSRLKRVDVEGPSPVTIIGKDQIDRRGYVSVADILGDLAQNSGGEFNQGVSFNFARGAQAVDLRGFGAGRTLILLDGRRLPAFPQGLGGTDSFVDLSTIPVALIDRVEVLTDGASAIYGSDAIGGVVNIITRKNVEQTTLTARASGTQDGGGSGRRLQFTTGSFDADSSYALTAEYNQQNPLWFRDRSYSDSDFNRGGLGSGFGNTFINDDGSTVVDPTCGTEDSPVGTAGVLVGTRCRFDRSKYRQFVPDTEKGSIYLSGERHMGSVTGYGRVGYYQANQIFTLEPNAYSGGESAAFTSNRIVPDSHFPDGPGYVADGAPNDPIPGDGMGGTFARRLVEFGPRGGKLRTEALTGLVGAKGTIGSYDWDVGLSRNEVRITQKTPTIISSVLDDMVSNEGLNLLEEIPTENLLRARHLQVESGVSRNLQTDATITGPLGFSLPGGAAQFALNVNYNQEEYEDTYDSLSLNGDVFDGGTSGGGDRDYAALGLEVNLPIMQNLELNLAGRYDRYFDDSDTGGAFSPRVAVGYRPIDTLLLRASAGKTFRAPDLQRLFGGSANGFDTVIDTPLCTQAGGTPGTPIDPNNLDDPCVPIQSVPSTSGSNPNLKEERGTNYNIGLSWEVFNNLNVTVDAYSIELKNIVSALSAQDILDKCATEGNFCDLIKRDANGLLGDGAGGSSNALISATAQNLAVRKTQGVDTSIEYKLNVKDLGKFTTQINWSVITSMKEQTTAGDPSIQQIGYAQIPKHRGNLTLDWEQDTFGLSVRGNWVGRYAGELIIEPAQDDEFVPTWITWDAQARYTYADWLTMRLGVNNLFNKDLPFDPTYAGGGANIPNVWLGAVNSYANAMGAEGYFQVELKF